MDSMFRPSCKKEERDRETNAQISDFSKIKSWKC
ncbi:hypothetical protein DNTS_005186, partial [Danionella cerebrum]